MELQQIRNACRVLMDDLDQPYLVSDETLDDFINQAEMEAADRACLIVDSTTVTTSRIDVVAGSMEYPLNDLVLDIKRVQLPSQRQPLEKMGYKALDDHKEDWQTRERTPTGYAMDMDTNTLYLSHIPITNETMKLTVVRLPLQKMVDDTDQPEIAAQYHYDLVYWVLSLVYQIRDSDINDPDLALKYEAKFERRFGVKKSAWDREFNKRAYRRRVKAHFL